MTKYIYQPDNSKADQAAGKLFAFAMCVVAALWAISYVYETVLGWYTSTTAWLIEMGDYLAGYWPF